MPEAPGGEGPGSGPAPFRDQALPIRTAVRVHARLGPEDLRHSAAQVHHDNRSEQAPRPLVKAESRGEQEELTGREHAVHGRGSRGERDQRGPRRNGGEGEREGIRRHLETALPHHRGEQQKDRAHQQRRTRPHHGHSGQPGDEPLAAPADALTHQPRGGGAHPEVKDPELAGEHRYDAQDTVRLSAQPADQVRDERYAQHREDAVRVDGRERGLTEPQAPPRERSGGLRTFFAGHSHFPSHHRCTAPAKPSNV